MKSFKQHITEKKQDVNFLSAMISGGRFNSSMEVYNYIKESDNFDIEFIGNGFFSMVFAGKDDPEYVMKIPRQDKDGSKKGIIPDKWRSFAKAAMRSNNPLIPKIAFYHDFEGHDFIAFVEVLKILPEASMNNWATEIWNKHIPKRKIFSKGENLNPIRNTVGSLTHLMGGIKAFVINKDPRWELMTNAFVQYFNISIQDLEEVFTIIDSIGNADIKSANVGFRPSNNQLVMFDPVA